jgi:hypothetical protein
MSASPLGLDPRNASLAVQAIAHTTGHANLKPDKT